LSSVSDLPPLKLFFLSRKLAVAAVLIFGGGTAAAQISPLNLALGPH
jgi:hypothetical protein